jgi:hypothetical protein
MIALKPLIAMTRSAVALVCFIVDGGHIGGSVGEPS